MARKGWSNLSHDRRVRLERRGITRAQYERGASLGERSYETRKAEAMAKYGLTPSQVTKIRKANPALAKEHDRITRLARKDPEAARRAGREVWARLSPDVKAQRFRATFAGQERDVVNPLTWYH